MFFRRTRAAAARHTGRTESLQSGVFKRPVHGERHGSNRNLHGIASLVVLIAYHFPPDNAIGGARPWRFYKYLKRLGYECHVLTAARQIAGAPSGH